MPRLYTNSSMSETFKNRFRVESTRLSGFDYSRPGEYFVTVCTEDRLCRFGNIENGEMQLSDMGRIVRDCWDSIPEHFSDIRTGGFVVMPNHLHGIIEILPRRDGACPVSTENDESRKRTSLATVVGSFKSACTRRIRKTYPESRFAWQSRFYDHVIRNDESLRMIREYIRINPSEWGKDEENPENFLQR